MQRLGRHAARLKALRRRVRERSTGEVVVDGPRLVHDLVRWQVPVRELYLATSLAANAVAAGLAESAEAVWEVDDGVLAGLAPTRHPQGVLAVVAEPRLPRWLAKDGIALYLDEIQDPGNTGAIVRSAAALGAGGVLLSPGCADPYHPAAVRGSAGAVFRVAVERDVPLATLTGRVRRHGGEVWAAAGEGVAIVRWLPHQPTLLVLGAEGRGVSAAALAAADDRVAVPLEHGVESLNVAVAAGILLHHVRTPRE